MTQTNLEGNWILKSGVGVQLLPNTKITAEFKDGKLSGHGGCNQYFAGYKVEKLDKTSGKIQIGNIGSTKIFCGEEINAQESSYFQALEQVSEYNLTDQGLILPYPSPSRYLLFTRRNRSLPPKKSAIARRFASVSSAVSKNPFLLKV